MSDRNLNDIRYQYLKEYLESYSIPVSQFDTLQTLMKRYYECRLDGTCAPTGGGGNYVPPVLVAVNPLALDVSIGTKGVTTVTVLQNTSTTAQEAVASIDSSTQTGIYVWQRTTNNAGRIFDTVSNNIPYSFSSTDFAQISVNAIAKIQGSVTLTNLFGSVLDGTVVLNLQERSIRFFNSAGTLTGLADAADSLLWDGSLFFSVATASSIIGDSITVYFDKTTFVHDVAAGDLGTYLAANPGWKQVGEV